MITRPTAAAYQAAFEAECRGAYPAIDAVEARYGFAVDRAKLEAAARVLACPLKKHAPNWQHGRVLYAVARDYLQTHDSVLLLDIGTAKGFSALCLQWALDDDPLTVGQVLSVDVIDPNGRVRRNTVAELDGYLTLAETLAPWPEASVIEFRQRTGAEALAWLPRVHLAYVDGKHTLEAVSVEATMLAERQQSGDVVVFDDAQIEGVARAILRAGRDYAIEYVDVRPERRYAIGVRRG